MAWKTRQYQGKGEREMSAFVPYRRRAQYYETDQMGIIHHANYIRWFEEARIDFLGQAGLGYREMEVQGILSPVLSVECEYKSMVHFGDDVVIRLRLEEYSGVRMTVAYRVEDADTGELRCQGKTRHCFLDREGRPVSLKRSAQVFDQLFREAQRRTREEGA